MSGVTVTTDGVDKNHVITLTSTHHPNNKKVWFSKQAVLEGQKELAGATMRLTGTLKDTTKTFNAKTWVIRRHMQPELRTGTGHLHA